MRQDQDQAFELTLGAMRTKIEMMQEEKDAHVDLIRHLERQVEELKKLTQESKELSNKLPLNPGED